MLSLACRHRRHFHRLCPDSSGRGQGIQALVYTGRPNQGFSSQGLQELRVSSDTDISHGSTVATNALLELKGARTALLVTEGFEDMLEIGRQNRPALYDFGVERPPQLVPPELRIGVRERLDSEGRAVIPLTTEDARRTSLGRSGKARRRCRSRIPSLLVSQS